MNMGIDVKTLLKRHQESVSAVYIEEKCSNVINDLVQILQIIEEQNGDNAVCLSMIHREVESALYDALKIIATTSDSSWDVHDSSLIANCGDAAAGWEAIQYKYTGQMKEIWSGYKLNNSKEFLDALLEEKTVMKAELACRKSFCEQAKELLQQPRGMSRTALNELLDSFAFPDRCFRRLSYLLDSVNLNTIDWNEFIERSIANLKYLEAQLNENGEEYIKRIQDDEKRKAIARRNGERFDDYTGEEQPYWESINI